MKCEYCGNLFSEEELDLENICSDCNEQYRCISCSCMSEDLNEDGYCEDCVREAGVDFMEAMYEC